MKGFNVLNDKGVFGVYALSTKGFYLYLAYFKDKQLWAVSVDKKLYISPAFEEHQANIAELVAYLIGEYKLPRVPLTELSNYFDKYTENELVTLARPKGHAIVSSKYSIPFLKGLGFNTDNLLKKLEGESVPRDYTSLLTESEDARFSFNLIKAKVEGKKMPKKYERVAKAIQNGTLTFMYLVGPAGTGKTFLTYFFSQYCNAPLLTYQGSEGVEKDEIIGASDVNTDQEAETQFKVIFGLLLRAYIYGYQIVIDEANLILPGVMAVINSMVDDTPTYTFKDKTYQRHENFVLYLTSNPGYEGTYLYNPATKSRGITIRIPKLTADEFASRLHGNTGGKLSKDFFKALYRLSDKVQATADKWGENTALCIRHAQHFADLILTESVTIEEFSDDFEVAFINNALSMDNDNSIKVDEFMNSKEVKEDLNKLYDMYDYKVVKNVDPEIIFDDFFAEGFDSVEPTEAAGTIDSSDFEKEFEDMFSDK